MEELSSSAPKIPHTPRARLRALLGSRLFLYLILVPIGLFIVYAGAQVLYKGYDTQAETKNLEEQITKLEKDQKRLVDLQNFLSTDFFAEKEARTKLGLQKKSEELVIVHPDQEASAQVGAQDGNKRPGSQDTPGNDSATKGAIATKSNFDYWWDYFFGTSENE